MILSVNMNPAVDKIYFVDNYQLGEVHRPRKTIVSAGGKGSNVARVAKQIGGEVIATGLIGGSSGNFIKRELERLGIDCSFSSIFGETRTCINVSDESKQCSTEVLESGPIISETEQIEFLELYKKLLRKVSVVTLSGSLPAGIGNDFYGMLIRLANKANKKVLLDTSGEALINGFQSYPYLIKPNKDEINHIIQANIFDDSNTIYEQIKWFKTYGIKFPIMSLGKEGAIAALDDGIYHFKISPVKIINTVGSGDSFIAGCAVAIDQGMNTKDVVKMGMACGIANTQFTQTGFVTKEKVDYYFKKVKVKKVQNY